MKYNININQIALAKCNIDLVGAAIMDYLYIICNSKNEAIQKQRKVIDGKWYTWVNYQKLMEDMPLLRINSKAAMSVRIKNLATLGFILISTDTKQQKTYITFTSKIDELFVETNGTVREDERYRSSRRTNNTTTNSITKTHIAASSAATSKSEPKPRRQGKQKRVAIPIDFIAEISKYEDSDQRHINIIASYMDYRKEILKKKITNSVQMQEFVSRHCPYAVKLTEMAYTDDQLLDAFDAVKKKHSDIDWTLETIYKELTK